MLTAYRRHRSECKHRSRRYKSCSCPIWVQGYLDGRPVRRSLDLTSWEAAQRKVRDLEIGGEANALSVDEACARWISDCEARGLADSTLRKYRERKAELIERFTEWQVRLKKLFVIAGVPDGHGHRFRHTLAKDLLERGVSLEMVAMILGNTVKIVEKHYSHWVKSRQTALEEAVKRTWL